VLDYLAAEVFASLAPEMQAFLLDTAVLERFCAPLCDAVLDERPKTKDESSTSFVLRPSSFVLEQLERANLFLVPLDAQRHWYRYHHLFAGFLRERLAHTAPQQVALLHGRAARWFEQQRLPSEAATHALAANDPVLAGRLVWMAAEDLVRQGEVLTLSGWIEALPHALVCQSAELSLWYAWVLALTLRQDQVAPWLAQVERLSSAEATGSEHAARLGQVAVVRATVCAGMGDLAGTIQHAQTALAGLPDRDTVLRAVVALNLGTAQAAAGNLTAAAVALTEALALSHASAHHYIYAGAAYLLGRLRLAQGWLHEAARICRQAHSQLAAADQQLATARVSILLSTVFCEWNDLAEAERLLGACMALIAQSGYAAVHLLGCPTQARIHWACGRVEQAYEWLH
jgi:LuxR family maltose regulon positive regulatory protein